MIYINVNAPDISMYDEISHEYETSKLWKQIPQQAAGYYTLRFAGLFNLPIPLRFAFGIGVSRIKKSACSNNFRKIGNFMEKG